MAVIFTVRVIVIALVIVPVIVIDFNTVRGINYNNRGRSKCLCNN